MKPDMLLSKPKIYKHSQTNCLTFQFQQAGQRALKFQLFLEFSCQRDLLVFSSLLISVS